MGPRNGRTFVNLENLPEASRKGTAAVKERSQRLKMNVLPVIREIQSLGVTTLEGIAGKLNERGLKAPRGGEWHKTSVSRVLMTLNLGKARKYPWVSVPCRPAAHVQDGREDHTGYRRA